ncbi:MAG: histidine phosphatase family protein [Bilifractor sp.]
MMEMALIRHGKTRGNTENRYIGTTDEPLLASETGRLQKKREVLSRIGFAQPDFLFVSPMKRCVETADILFQGICQIPVQDFRECDFGDFENRNYQELSGNADYQRWIDSGGTLPFPGGESMASFQERVCRAFMEVTSFLPVDGRTILHRVADHKGGLYQTTDAINGACQAACDPDDVRRAAIVAHGGTIMAILERFGVPHRGYFDWHVDNGCGFLVAMENKDGEIRLSIVQSL